MKTLLEIVLTASTKPRTFWTLADEFAYFLFVILIVAACLGVAALIIAIIQFFKNRK